MLLLVLGGLVTSGTSAQWTHDRVDASPPRPDHRPLVDQRTNGQLRCTITESCQFFKDVLLVVKLNPVRLHWLDAIQRFYSAGIPNIEFYSSLKKGDPHEGGGKFLVVGAANTTVHLIEDNYGFCDHFAVTTAARAHPEFTGYLFLSDDLLLQFWRLVDFDKTKVWRQQPVYGEKKARVTVENSLRTALRELAKELPDGQVPNEADVPFASTSGVYYIPSAHAPMFSVASRILLRHRTYNEYGTPIALHVLTGRDFVPLPGTLVWGKKRLRVRQLLRPGKLWQHPVRATGEVFARVTHAVLSQPEKISKSFELTDAIFRVCMHCASYPPATRRMKGLLHACFVAAENSKCVDPATTIAREWPELSHPEHHVGYVHVSPSLHHIDNPFELRHEGFWGESITNYVFNEYYPLLNRTRMVSRQLNPYPECCVL